MRKSKLLIALIFILVLCVSLTSCVTIEIRPGGGTAGCGTDGGDPLQLKPIQLLSFLARALRSTDKTPSLSPRAVRQI